MFKISPETGGNVVGLIHIGKLGASDFEEMPPEFERIVSNCAGVRILLDWEHLVGWSEEGESVRFFTRIWYRKFDIGRIAIVGEEKWRREAGLLKEIVGCDVRFFHPAGKEAAWRWLKID